MPDINNRTLQIAIATIAGRIRLLEARLADEIAAEDEDAGYTQQELLDYQAAADDLERAYDAEVRSGVINLSPYDALTGEGG